MGMSVPAFAAANNLGLDRLRKLLRRDSELAGVLVEVGGVRLVPPEKLEEFRARVMREIVIDRRRRLAGTPSA